jgi:hypothetical protein
MTFATLRQKVLQSHVLNASRFGEEVELGAPDGSGELLSVRALIEHDVYRAARRLGSSDQMQGTFDERERIRVTLSRDVTWGLAYPSRPPTACPLHRSEEVDADRRPFTFRGDVVHEGDQHAVYIFERPRRAVQGKGT